MTRRKRRKSSRRSITSIHVNAAGIDIGATFHVVAVPPERVEMSVRTFRSFTGDLHQLADWLAEVGIYLVHHQYPSAPEIKDLRTVHASGNERIFRLRSRS